MERGEIEGVDWVDEENKVLKWRDIVSRAIVVMGTSKIELDTANTMALQVLPADLTYPSNRASTALLKIFQKMRIFPIK